MWNTEALARLQVIFWHFSGKTQEYNGKCRSEQQGHHVKPNRKYSWLSEFALSHPEHKSNCLRVWNEILKCMDSLETFLRTYHAGRNHVPERHGCFTFTINTTLIWFSQSLHDPYPSRFTSSFERFVFPVQRCVTLRGKNGLMDVIPSSWSFELALMAWSTPRLCLAVLKPNIYK